MSISADPSHMQGTPPVRALLCLIMGNHVSRAIYTVAKLGIADLLRDGPQGSDVLAQATGTDTRALYRVLRTLASIGVLVEDEAARFGLTPIGACLQTGVPGSLRAYAILTGEENYRAWAEVLYSVRTGKSAFEQVFGMGVYDYRAHHPEAAAVFNEAMTEWTQQAAQAVVAAYDFSACTRVVDVGGGQGDLLMALLQAYPHLQGVLVELPYVAAAARPRLEAAGLASRCEVVAGDFFAVMPSGGDVYILKNVIDSFEDDRTVRLLQHCHRSMTPQGKLLVVGQVIRPGNDPAVSKLLDLGLLVNAGGPVCTEAELHRLFAAAGFQLTRIFPTQAAMEDSIIEGVRSEPV
jgi:O-methyltransferase domain/Dimerisation domain